MEPSEAESMGLVVISKPGGGLVGAGLILDDRHVVTCAHVVMAALQLAEAPDGPPVGAVTVDFSALGGATTSATVVDKGWAPITEDGRGDIAVLRLTEHRPQVAVPVIRVARGTLNHRFRAYGFPRNDDFGVAAMGRLLGRSGPGWQWVQIGSEGPGAPIESGFSGSPVWDDDLGAVVGIIVAQDRRPWVRGEAQTAWMIPAEVLVEAWPAISESVQSPLMLDPALPTHWDPRARGLELGSERGWYFTGRTRVMRELVGWLKDSPQAHTRARVVIGRMGSGKSAVLARLVTLSDPQYRRRSGFPSESTDESTRPPDNAIDIAVHANGKTLEQLVEVIADAADVTADDPKLLVDKLRRRAPVTIVIDSINEAEQPHKIARELLRPLAKFGPDAGVRLLVAAPRELLGALGSQMKVIDLDDPANIERDDISRYVEQILLGKDSRQQTMYRQDPALASKVAAAVADRAYPSFLIAQLAARSLVDRREVIDTVVPGWDDFPQTVDDAMDDYLSRFDDGAERRRVCQFLGALAWAEGQGLPSETIWPTVAGALAGTSFTNDDVEWLLDRAAGFIVDTHAEGGPTYRLFHAALAVYLQRSDTGTHPRPWIQNRITEALLRTVPVEDGRKDWQAAHPYVKAHLAAHAMAAAEDPQYDLLDTILTDPGFLLAADPRRVLRAVPKALDKPARLAARAFSLNFDYLRTKPPAEWSAYLEFAARRSGAQDLATRIEEEQSDRPWAVRWIKGRTEPANYVAAHHDDSVSALAMGMLEDSPVVVSAGDEGQVRVSDLVGAELVYEPLMGDSHSVYALAVGVLDGQSIIVSGGEQFIIRFWNLSTGESIGEEIAVNGTVHALAIGTRRGRPVVVAGISDNTVGVWDLGTHERVLPQLIGHERRVYAVATGIVDGRPIIASGGQDKTVRLWDLETGTLMATLEDPTDSVNAVAVGAIGEQNVVISGDDGSTILVWDLAAIAAGRAPKPRSLRSWHSAAVNAVGIGTLNWGPIIVSGSSDGMVQIWDPDTGGAIGQPLKQALPIRALALGHAEGRRVIVFGGEDRTVRVWNPPTGTPISEPSTGEEDAVNTVAVGVFDGEQVAVSGAEDGSIGLWDLETGQQAELQVHKHRAAVNAVTINTLDGHTVLASGGQDHTIRVYDLTVGEPKTWSPIELKDAVNAVTLGHHPDGRPVLVSGGADDMIRVWDLATGAPVGRPFADHTAPVNAVALVRLGGEVAVVSGSDDGTVLIWDLAKGTPIGLPLTSDAHKIHALTVGTLDGQQIVAAGGTHSLVNIWTLATRAPLGPLAGHEGPVNTLAIGGLEGRTALAAGDSTGTVRVWDLNDRREPLVEVDTGFGVRAVAFGANSMIAVGGSTRLLGMQVRRPASNRFGSESGI
jgi:WD40 repeat protein